MASKFLDSLSVPAFDFAQRIVMRKSNERASRLGERLGLLAFRLDKKHRARTISNLKLAFPEWSEVQTNETAKGVFKHFGLMMVQFMRSPVRSPEGLIAGTEVVGLEHLEAAEAKGCGVMLVTGHFGNWEWVSGWFGAVGRKLCTVQREGREGGIDGRLRKLREATGMEVLARGSAARSILQRLKRNERVGLLADQNAGDAYVPFFGKPAGTVTGPAVLALRNGSPIVPFFGIQLDESHLRLEFFPALEPKPGDDPATSIMAAYHANLEAVIRRYPEQWLWMHDRWKSARQQGML